MQFTVTYRSRSGTVETEVFDSASRAELFRQLQGRGISPIKVAEGAQGAKPKSGGKVEKGEARRSLPVRYWLLAVLVLAVGVCVWLCIGPAKPRPAAVGKPSESVPKRDQPKPMPQKRAAPQDAVTATNGAAHHAGAETKKAAETPPKPKEEIISVVTNRSGYIIERIRNPDGTTSKRVHSLPPVFRHASDQMIAMVLSVPPGQAIPPMPMNAFTDEEFKRALEEDIAILDSDSDEIKELKAKVIVARSEIKSLMASGASAFQILQEHQNIFNDNAKLHADALIEMKSILASGDREEARKYAIAMNAAFQQMGVQQIPVPGKDDGDEADSRAGRARERLRERLKARKEQRQ